MRLVDLCTIASHARAPVCLPVLARQLLELRLKRRKVPFFLVQLAFKLGDSGVLLAVPAVCVEHLQKRGEDRVLSVGTARGISLAADVEKNALRRCANRPLDKSFKERQFFLPFAEGDEDIRRLFVAYVMIFEDSGEDFEKVRLA